jgi:lycopene beta-cyclase
MIASRTTYDYVMVGGGLQAGLLALAIDYYQPEAKVLLLEKNERLFGNHTWSFHRGDVSRELDWLKSLPMNQWPAYTVHFPGLDRKVELPYCSTSSRQFETAIDHVIHRRGNLDVRTSTTVSELGSHRVLTSDGMEFQGGRIVDCRGQVPHRISGVGFQKFYGLEIELDEDWPDHLPVLMEANVDQSDGFRFLYVLPFTRRRVLIEDTRFSDSDFLDKANSLKQIKSFLKRKSVLNWQVLREEEGCLPMPFTSAFKPTASDLLAGGFAGGWFHAATGYSFPLAARFADVVASSTPQDAHQRILQLAHDNRFQSSFSRFLNRMLFRLVLPNRRFEVFRRFYHALPNQTIQRFYAHTFTKTDAARILFGAPPRGLTPVRFLQSF